MELGEAHYGSRVLGEPNREVNVETRECANRETVDDLGGEGGGGVSERRRKIDGFVCWASSVTGFRAFGLAEHSCCKVSESVNREGKMESGVSGGKDTSLGSENGRNNDGIVTGVKVDEGEGNADGIDMGSEKGNEGARVPQMCPGGIEVSTDKMVETEERRSSDQNNVVGANVIDMGGEKGGNEGARVPQMCPGDIEVSIDRMVETEGRRTSDENNVVGVIDMGGEKGGNEGARVPQMCSGDFEVSIDRMAETEERRTRDENNVVGAIECVSIDGTGVNVVGDMKEQNCAGEKHLSGHAIDGEGIGDEEDFNESNVNLYDAGVNNAAASIHEGVSPNENQDVVCKEPIKQVNLESMEIDFTVPKIRGEECLTETEGEYYRSDLVWGKVRRHPWWPGQIFEPSAASEKALKHSKKEGYLIAYFGNQTFAWNEAAKIKPFHLCFPEMEKQSNLKAFSRAVGCTLNEVSRRVEFGLSCSCLPAEKRAKIECQTVVNGGILEEAGKRYGGDKLLGAHTFVPADLLRDFKSLAASRTRTNPGIDRLRFAVTKAQLVAFNRWKSVPQFTKLECEALSRKLHLVGIRDKSSNKSATESKGNRGRKRSLSSSSKKQDAAVSVPSDSKLKRRKRTLSPTRLQTGSPSTSTPEVGHKILQNESVIDGQKLVEANFPTPKEMLSKLCLAASDPVVGYGSIYPFISLFSNFRNSVCLESSVQEEIPSTPTLEFGHKSPQKGSSIGGQKLVDADFPPPKEMLSKLHLAALDPIEGYGSIYPYISLLSNFRNSTGSDTKKKGTQT